MARAPHLIWRGFVLQTMEGIQLYPNIGIGEPSSDGIILKYHSDKEFLKLVNQSIDMGASVIGGCCGSTPNHISLIKEQIDNY